MKTKYEINNCLTYCEKANYIYGYSPAFHQRIELIQIVEGELDITIDDKSTILKPGDISVCFPLINHSNQASKDVVLNFVFFPPEVCPAFLKLMQSSKPVCPFIRKEMTTPLLNSLISKAVSPGEPLKQQRQNAYLNAIMAEIISIVQLEDSPISNTNVISSILLYCSDHFQEEISLNQIAKALFLSPQHISYIFSNKLKCNFRTYINSLRIEKAKQLLKNTERSITDIMYECGYKNQGTFNRVFQNLCNMTPQSFREL